MQRLPLSRAELEQFAANDVRFYGLELSRISSIFIAQIFQMQMSRTINTFSVLDEIKYLEGLNKRTNTADPNSFTRMPLGELKLKKKHFMDASFILQNLNSHFGFQWGGNKNLDEVITKAFERNTSGVVDNEFASFLAHQVTIDALKSRMLSQGRLTGEWIVFKEYGAKNYYLTLAAHDEGDDNIYKRVCDVYDFDFPFLRTRKKDL